MGSVVSGRPVDIGEGDGAVALGKGYIITFPAKSRAGFETRPNVFMLAAPQSCPAPFSARICRNRR